VVGNVNIPNYYFFESSKKLNITAYTHPETLQEYCWNATP